MLLMASHPAATEKTFQHIEFLVNGAAPLAASDVERFMNKAKVRLPFHSLKTICYNFLIIGNILM